MAPMSETSLTIFGGLSNSQSLILNCMDEDCGDGATEECETDEGAANCPSMLSDEFTVRAPILASRLSDEDGMRVTESGGIVTGGCCARVPLVAGSGLDTSLLVSAPTVIKCEASTTWRLLMKRE